jgi:hypothetical protein
MKKGSRPFSVEAQETTTNPVPSIMINLLALSYNAALTDPVGVFFSLAVSVSS